MYQVIFTCEFCKDTEEYSVYKKNDRHGSELVTPRDHVMNRTACHSCAPVVADLGEKVIDLLKAGKSYKAINDALDNLFD